MEEQIGNKNAPEPLKVVSRERKKETMGDIIRK